MELWRGRGAGLIFKLNSENMESAFGIAECQTSGSMRFLADGAWTKRFQVGYAGHNGLIAACLAREGFKGPIGSVEGKDGFLKSYAPSPDLSRATQDLGEVWETMNIVKPILLAGIVTLLWVPLRKFAANIITAEEEL